MTIKDLAYFTDKNKSTIGRWVAKCNSHEVAYKLQNATRDNPADFTVDEVESILNASSLSKDAVLILMANAREAENPKHGQLADMEQFAKLIGIAISQAMAPVVARLESLEVKQLTAPKEDYFSLLAYCSLHDIDTNRSELAVHGMELRKMTISSGKNIRKIPDERYGQVNSYPVEILTKYFEV